jgi:hypothetical protein
MVGLTGGARPLLKPASVVPHHSGLRSRYGDLSIPKMIDDAASEEFLSQLINRSVV